MARRARRWLAWTVAAVAAANLVSTACRRGPDDVRSVLLVSIDTCRADHLGCYGHPGGTTPNLDRLAASGAVFTGARSPAPITLPAHSSLLTGLLPPDHGVRDNVNYRLPEGVETLAEILRAGGLTTGAVVSAFVLDSRFGLAQGFSSYDDRFEASLTTAFGNERRADEAVSTAVSWLERHRSEPFFLFLHVYDPHWPYQPPEPWATSFSQDPYSGEIAFVDHCLGTMLDSLRRLDLEGSTLVVVAGDHGEMLGEHGETTHTYLIYEPAVLVPLIVRWPGAPRGVRVDEPVGLVDIVPTVCSALGLEPPTGARGVSLAGLVHGSEAAPAGRRLYLESLTPTRYGACSLAGIVAGRWKYVDATRPELYDLQADPGETTNLVAQRADEAAGFRREVVATLAASPAADRRLDLDPASLERLEALGYVSGSVDETLVERRDLPDAKDLLGFHEDHQRAIDLIARERWDEAWAVCAGMVERRPDFFEAHTNLARIAMGRGDLEAAVRLFRHTLSLRPDQYAAHHSLGVALTALGRSEEASEAFRSALELAPNPVEARLNLATALTNQGRLAEARVELEEVVRRAPASPTVRGQLAAVLARQGETAAAAEQWQEAVRLSPDDPEMRLALGTALLDLGRADEAATHLRRAVEREPERVEVANDAGARLARSGRVDLAAEFFEAAVRADPTSAEARRNLAQALLSGGRPDDAERHIRALLDLDPADADSHAMLALALAGRGDTEGAVRQLRTALRLDPSTPAPRHQLAALLTGLGRSEEARRELEAALELEPTHTPSRVLLAQILARGGRIAEAIEHLRVAVERDPGSVEARYNLAMAVLARGGDGALEEGAAGLRQVVALAPDVVEAHLNLAAAELRLGREHTAAEHYERAVELDPSLVAALDTLAWILATTPEDDLADPARAVALSRRACAETGSSQPELLDTLAVALAASGDFEGASATAEKALELATSAGRNDLALTLRERLAAFARHQVPLRAASGR